MSSQLSLLGSENDDNKSVKGEIAPRRLLSVPDLPPHLSVSQVSNISMPTITKETVVKYRSRPVSATPSPDDTAATATESPPATETEGETQQRSSQGETKGHKIASKVTSKVADKVKSILTGQVAGKVTANIMGKVKRKDEATASEASPTRPSVEANAAQDGSGGQNKLSSTVKATLSNPGMPSVLHLEDSGGGKRTDFPQPFYSPLGRYRPHEPGDEAFSPITLAMSFDAEETNRGSAKRPTLLIRRTLTGAKQGSKASLTVPSSTPRGAGGTPREGGSSTGVVISKAGGGGGPEDGSKTNLGVESGRGLDAESAVSSAMLQSVVSIMKFMTQASAQARETTARASEMPVAEAAGRSSAADGEEPHPKDTLAPGPMTEEEMEALRLSVRAMVGLQRWKKRANARLSQRAGPHVTVKTFAKNPKHSTTLHKNMEELATELPLPLKKTLYDEAFPILNDIVHAYERTLGKSNSLTEQAKAKLESMAKFIKDYDEM